MSIEESKDLDTIKIEELVGSLQTYELTISQSKKNKSIAMNIVREEKYDSTDAKIINDEKIAYFAKKFQHMFRNKKKPQERHRDALSESKNRSQPMRYHKCQGFGHYKSECPDNKKNQDTIVIIT